MRVAAGLSGVHIAFIADNNGNYDPSGAGPGETQQGVYVASSPAGDTNNHVFLGGRVNAVAYADDGFSLKVGDPGPDPVTVPPVQSFAWIGGLLQGSSSHQEFYLRCYN